ncbi:MepB family protein [Chryseobacterium tructae]|uniref:MepB family protein n=1 Tax=Chryseobacterium tructae TaxID=1037380 RepID=A0ABV7XXW1_9FLAO|nr:MepB family protein [Chryseobacterium tructae]MDN3692891.1 MepB family protein [Chryseobacterium tructae]
MNCSALEEDLECKEYSGFNFRLNNLNIKFRISKITPTKTGQFVTIWKRNEKGETAPFDIKDDIDFYLVAAFKDNFSGIFIFPKSILAGKGILSDGKKTGKRGIRVYPAWDKTESKQAQKTQDWQTQYFLVFSGEQDKILQRARALLK